MGHLRQTSRKVRTVTWARGAIVAALMMGVAAAPDIQAADASREKAAFGALELAKLHYKEGRYEQAAKLFHQAYQIHPIPGFLFNAARAEQRAFKLDAAQKDYQRVIDLKDVDAETKRRAQLHLKEIIETRKHFGVKGRKPGEAAATAPTKTPPKKVSPEAKAPSKAPPKTPVKAVSAPNPPPGVSKEAPSPWNKPAGWASLGVGLIAAGLGGVMWAGVESDQAALTKETDKRDSSDKIPDLEWNEYTAEQDQLNSDRKLWAVSTFAGVAVASAGAYLLWGMSDGGDVALMPGPTGRSFTLAVAF